MSDVKSSGKKKNVTKGTQKKKTDNVVNKKKNTNAKVELAKKDNEEKVTKKIEKDLKVKEEENVVETKSVKKEQVIIFVIGFVIGLLTMILFYPDRIAKLENGEEVAIRVGKTDITADTMYVGLKENFGINQLLETIDKTILEKKYELSDEDNKTIKETADNYISRYESSGYTKEEFLNNNGFDSYEDFVKYLELDYRRNLYYQDYLDKEITEEEIDKYYNESVFGSIKTEHILVKSSVENAEEKANEILNKLKSGSTWDSLKTEYASVITTEEVPVNFDSSLESAYMTEATKLTDGSYSESLVKTSYGYHIVYRISSEAKPEKETVLKRIKDVIKSEKSSEDSKLYEKVMIKMREEANTEIKDTELKKAYDKYVKQFE